MLILLNYVYYVGIIIIVMIMYAQFAISSKQYIHILCDIIILH